MSEFKQKGNPCEPDTCEPKEDEPYQPKEMVVYGR